MLCCRHTPIFESVMGCHGNHAFSHIAQTGLVLDNFVLYKGGPNKKNGTHEKLSKSAR